MVVHLKYLNINLANYHYFYCGQGSVESYPKHTFEYHALNSTTLGTKFSAKKMVVNVSIPATNTPVPMLM